MIRWLVLACIFLFSLYPTITRIKLFQEFSPYYQRRYVEMELQKIRQKYEEQFQVLRAGQFDGSFMRDISESGDEGDDTREISKSRHYYYLDEEEIAAMEEAKLSRLIESRTEDYLQRRLGIDFSKAVEDSVERNRAQAALDKNELKQALMKSDAQDIAGETDHDEERIRNVKDSSLPAGGIPAAKSDRIIRMNKERQPRPLPDAGRQERMNDESLPETNAEATSKGNDAPTNEAELPPEDSGLDFAGEYVPLRDLESEDGSEAVDPDISAGDSNSETDAFFAQGPIKSGLSAASTVASNKLDDKVDEIATERIVLGAPVDSHNNIESHDKLVIDTERSEDGPDIEERIKSDAHDSTYQDRISLKLKTGSINDYLHEDSSTENEVADDEPRDMESSEDVPVLDPFEHSVQAESEMMGAYIATDEDTSEKSDFEDPSTVSQDDASGHVDTTDSESESRVFADEESTFGEEERVSDTTTELPQFDNSPMPAHVDTDRRFEADPDADLIDFDELDGANELEFSLSTAASNTFGSSRTPAKYEAGMSEKELKTDAKDKANASTSKTFMDIDDTTNRQSADFSGAVPITEHESRSSASEDNSESTTRKTPKEGSLASFFQKVSERDNMRRQAKRKTQAETKSIAPGDRIPHLNFEDHQENSPDTFTKSSWGAQIQYEVLGTDSTDNPPPIEDEKSSNDDEIYEASHVYSAADDAVGDVNDQAEVLRPKASSVNDEFVEGLDDIDKFLEKVEPPDELDVGAAGSSIQEVLMGKGTQIVMKRIVRGFRHVRQHVKARVDKFKMRHRKPSGEFALASRERFGSITIKVKKASTVVFNEARGIIEDLFGLGDDYDAEDDFSLTEMELSLQNMRQKVAQKQTMGATNDAGADDDIDAFIRRQMAER